jgi:type VI secretion system protein ImpC
VGAFARLRGLREELDTAGGFARAAAALGFAGAAPTASPTDTGTAADIERLLGRPPQQAPAAAPATPLDAWLRDLVAPHVVADTSGPQRMLTAAIDASLADLMRALLRDPALRRLEAAWRGVARLVAELGGEPSIEIWLLDASREELDAEVRAFSGDLSASTLWRILGGEDAEGVPARPWSVVAVDSAFGPGPGDVALLAALGSMAGRVGAALLADADPSVLGCARTADLRNPAAWQPLDPDAGERWRALRAVDAAPWIGLALPRVLMRRPYGAKSDPLETFAFEELTDPADADAYLWGSGALLLAVLAGRAFRDAGDRMDLDDSLEADDMPVHSWRADGEPKLRACAETLLPDSAAERILSAGPMPLVASAGAGTVRLLRWQSIADPLQRLRGPWD